MSRFSLPGDDLRGPVSEVFSVAEQFSSDNVFFFFFVAY